MSEWTVDTVNEHLKAMIGEADRRNEQRFAAQEKAVAAALQAAKEAVAKAEIAAEKRFDSVNEFRAQLSDQAGTFMPRREAEQRADALAEKLNEVSSRIDRREGQYVATAKGGDRILSIVMAIIAAISVIALVLK